MPTTRKTPQTVVLDPVLVEESDAVDTVAYTSDEDPTAAFSDEVAAPVCPGCGELLAWHEEPCRAVTASTSAPELTAAEAADDSFPSLVPSSFTYALGQLVQPAPAMQAGRVIWRGQVKERHPRTGLLHRVNVYRLDNGYWDCYYEAELQAA